MRTLFKRCELNPLITVRDIPYPANTVFNAGAVDMGDKVLLLLRVESCSGRSHLTLATSEDGVTNWHVEDWAFLHPGEGFHEESYGVEDCRITWMEEMQTYLIAYTAYGEHGPAVALARTNDFRQAARIGIAFPPDNKDAVVFPKKINGHFVMLHRPSVGGGSIWIGYSKDLIYWGRSQALLSTRGGPWWDGFRVGAGLVPIETKAGWLLIYHGVKQMASGPIYRIGGALLDLEDPSKLIARSKNFLMTPIELYERVGDVPNVLFPTGGFIRDNELWMYYGAADSSVCLARASLYEILDELIRF